MKFYRYRAENSAVHDIDGELMTPSIPNPYIVLEEYFLNRETPKGYWIGYEENGDGYLHSAFKWVSKTARKRYAYPTKEEALQSFIKRKEKQIKILKYQLSNAGMALLNAKSIKI
jgi:hypothetical protein